MKNLKNIWVVNNLVGEIKHPGCHNGTEFWDSIEEFGIARIDFLKKVLSLPYDIPSHDTINRVFSMFKPDKFESVFINWTDTLRDKTIFNDCYSHWWKNRLRLKRQFPQEITHPHSKCMLQWQPTCAGAT